MWSGSGVARSDAATLAERGSGVTARRADRPARGAASARAGLAFVVPLALGACAGWRPDPGPASPPTPSPPSVPVASTASVPEGRGIGEAFAGTGGVSVESDRRPGRQDSDRDRVPDDEDDCPATGSGEPVDGSGCALFTRALEGVVFALDDHRLDADARRALERLVADLEAYPDVVLELAGHTDNRGLAVANLRLSKRRVMSVARFLVSRGIAPERLRPYGYGESRPRTSNRTPLGRERNRRIEIELGSAAGSAPAVASGRLPEPPPPVLAEPDAARQNASSRENIP